jgi:diguanylate cyclase (GGDEF)-like protein
MHIDWPTLMLAGSFVSAVSGVFLIFAWLQTRSGQGMLWWAAGNLTLALAIPFLVIGNAGLGGPSAVLAITLLNLSPALIWASARACNDHRVDLGVVGSGCAIWLVAFTFPAFRETPAAQLSLNLFIAAVFVVNAAIEFWRGRGDNLTARWPLITLLGLHGAFSAAGAVAAAVGAVVTVDGATLLPWLGFVHFETLAFVVGTSIFTVAMARERQELLHKTNANTDALTGVATRRAFYEDAEHMLLNAREHGRQVTVILFDVDLFKSINDTYGHSQGDEVLRMFGNVARRMLRTSDLIARLGGEEFAALLPGAGVDAAYVIAERIRVAFTAACRPLGPFTATVSAGVALAGAEMTVQTLVHAADEALYRAKTKGRDRVEIAGFDDKITVLLPPMQPVQPTPRVA